MAPADNAVRGRRSRFFLTGLVLEVADGLDAFAKKRNVEMRVEAEDEVWLASDRTEAKRILVALVGNAIRSARDGSVTLTVRGTDGRGEVEIQNAGIDIALPFVAPLAGSRQ